MLVGGRSARMGRDKAGLPVGARRLCEVVVAELAAAGCDPVCTVGGASFVAVEGVPHLIDSDPGGGPLAALGDALRWASPADVIVLPTDLPWVTADALGVLVDATPGRTTLVARGGTLASPCGRWAPTALDAVEACLAEGRRALGAAIERIAPVIVDGGPEFDDADTPDDLDRPVP